MFLPQVAMLCLFGGFSVDCNHQSFTIDNIHGKKGSGLLQPSTFGVSTSVAAEMCGLLLLEYRVSLSKTTSC